MDKAKKTEEKKEELTYTLSEVELLKLQLVNSRVATARSNLEAATAALRLFQMDLKEQHGRKGYILDNPGPDGKGKLLPLM